MDAKLIKLIEKAEKERLSILLIGKFGIGKSFFVYKYAEKKAKELGKIFVKWHELNENEKKEIIENCDKYYVLVDIKGSMISLDNLVLPFLSNNNELIWKVPLWVKLFEKENSSGILFIDEINMTSPSLQSLLFELILQRKIAETSLKSKNLLIISAGNDLDSNEYANEIPKPLANRFILINFDEFVSLDSFVKYMKDNDFDNRIISYVLFKNSFFTKSKESLKQSTSPRSIEFLNKLIKGENDLEYIRICSKACLEENDSLEFISFVEMYEKLTNIEKYLDYPIEKLKELKNDELFIITMKLNEMFINNKIDAKKFVEFLEKLAEFRNEYVLVCIKLIKLSNDKNVLDRFVKNLSSKGKVIKTLEELIQYFNF